MNYPATIGKIEDAGTLVRGGRIDQHWQQEGHRFYMKDMIGVKDFSAPSWMVDSNKVMERFNLRSIEFGNWMNQEDRLNFLVATAYSLHELARILGVKNEQMGLGRRLSIALGARGKGPAAGHFEPSPRFVINITKTAQVGVLAHEYAHAIDNLLSFHTGGKRQSYVSGGRTTRKGFNQDIASNGNYFEQQFEDFFNRLYFNTDGNYTRFANSIKNFDEYWNRRNEVFARTFESWTYARQKEIGSKNQFLVSAIDDRVYPNAAEVGQVARIIEDIMRMAYKVFKDDASLSGIDGYQGVRTAKKENATLDDTLQHMKRMALEYHYQVSDLAEVLKGRTVKESASNIWHFLRENTAYKLDQDGIEELRTPARSLADGKAGLDNTSFGIDCDDYTILISALLLEMGVSHEYRVAAYKAPGKFQHIYPVAFDKNGNSWVIDVVPEIPHFNFEQTPIADIKIVKMELQELSGTAYREESSSSDEFKNDIMEELNEPFSLSGTDDPDDDVLDTHFLAGFQEVDSEEEAEVVLSGTEVTELVDRGLLAEINKARLTLEKEQNQPTSLSQVVNVPQELNWFRKIMAAWSDQEERVVVLQQAIVTDGPYTNFFKSILYSLDKLDKEAGLSGFDDEPIMLARVSMDDFLEDDLDGLGRSRRRRGRLKKFFKKVGAGIKKGLKAVVRFNPATIAMRAAALVVLKTNLFKLAEKLIYGYLSESEAMAKGLDLNEYRKVKSALSKVENFYVKAGGKADKLRAAIIKGRAAKKSGLNLSGMGAAATATTAAASPFIVMAKKLLSSINLSKLFKSNKNSPSQSSDMNTSLITSNSPLALPDDIKKPSFVQKARNLATKHKKPLLIAMIITLVAIVVGVYMKRRKSKGLSGVKRARSYARKRRPVRAKVTASRTPRRRRKASSRGLALKGSTTVIKVPTSSVKRTRVARRSNTQRLKLMHKKAQELKKKSPNTKYSTLLKRASKLI